MSASEMKPYDPNKVSIVIGRNEYIDFSDTDMITINQPRETEIPISITLEGVGKVTGFVYLSDEQFIKFKEKY